MLLLVFKHPMGGIGEDGGLFLIKFSIFIITKIYSEYKIVFRKVSTRPPVWVDIHPNSLLLLIISTGGSWKNIHPLSTCSTHRGAYKISLRRGCTFLISVYFITMVPMKVSVLFELILIFFNILTFKGEISIYNTPPHPRPNFPF